MRRKPLNWMGGAVAAAVVTLALIGCRGAAGPAGTPGQSGTNGTGPTVSGANLTTAEWSQLSLSGSVLGVTVGSKPVVNFKVTDGHGTPVSGLGFTSQASTSYPASYPNFAFSLAKLVPGANGSPSRWVSYIVTTAPTSSSPNVAPTRPTTDNTGTLVDHGDGTYTYTFYRDITQTQAFLDGYTYTGNNARADLDDTTYQATLTHRLTVFVGGNARGTSTNTADGSNSGIPGVPVLSPANLIYDFIPSTGAPVTSSSEQREIVSVDKCFTCHTKFTFHGTGRQDTRYCVMCHNDQRKYGRAEATKVTGGYDPAGTTYKIQGHAVGDLPTFIHKIHMGEELTQTGYNYANEVYFNEITYPQDQRNCVKCHSASTATPQGDNWMNKPSRFACGACHDQVDWASGTNHQGGVAANDQQCAQCHSAAEIQLYHIPQVAADPTFSASSHTNGAAVAAYPNHLPAGAHVVTWDLKKAELVAGQPVFTFRFIKDGTPVVFNDADKPELMAGYVGGPSVYLAFALPQDNIQTPSDWNATVSGYIRNIWNGTATGTAAGTMTGPDGSGYYQITLTGVVIPANATLFQGGIGYTYGGTSSQPLTQIDNALYPYDSGTKIGGLSVPAPNVSMPIDPKAARRPVVSTAKCNDCHGRLGVFTAKVFHAGERNDAATCSFCHNVNRVNNGWGVNEKDFVHALHGASKRANKFSWEVGAGDKYWNITYPGVLNNCEACHLPGTYDFSATASANALPNLLWTTVATGTVADPWGVVITGTEPDTAPVGTAFWSPFVTGGAVYGKGFSYTSSTGVVVQAASTTLVNSPIVSACVACHDSSTAIAHMKQNGGTFYQPRSTAFQNQEQCLLCHAPGKVADIKAVHMTFK